MASGLTTHIAKLVRQRTGDWPAAAEMDDLNELLRLMGRWRSQVLANTFIAQHGPRILGGPFAGMEYVSQATEGALVPRLLGTYESELHPHLQALLASGVDCVIDVGCAEGYYAVGLARLAPEVTVYAYDIDENARRACAELAARNGVSDRVVIGGEFAPEDFQRFAGRRALVMVDTEGAEVAILDPDRGPALKDMWIIVETHDGITPGARETLTKRFEATHDIVQLDPGPKAPDMPWWLKELGHLDQLLAVWEWRSFPTPWLVMTPKSA